MKGIGKKTVIPVAFVLVGGILLWIIGSPARNAKQIVPGMSFDTVLKLLGGTRKKRRKGRDESLLLQTELCCRGTNPGRVRQSKENGVS